jgi:hypothetical protein
MGSSIPKSPNLNEEINCYSDETFIKHEQRENFTPRQGTCIPICFPCCDLDGDGDGGWCCCCVF